MAVIVSWKSSCMVLVIGELAISIPSLRMFCVKREYYSSGEA
jgi:hypothetical protein